MSRSPGRYGGYRSPGRYGGYRSPGRYGRGGYGYGAGLGTTAGLIGGLALGSALAAPRYGYGPGYGYGSGYDYGYGPETVIVQRPQQVVVPVSSQAEVATLAAANPNLSVSYVPPVHHVQQVQPQYIISSPVQHATPVYTQPQYVINSPVAQPQYVMAPVPSIQPYQYYQ